MSELKKIIGGIILGISGILGLSSLVVKQDWIPWVALISVLIAFIILASYRYDKTKLKDGCSISNMVIASVAIVELLYFRIATNKELHAPATAFAFIILIVAGIGMITDCFARSK